MEKTTKTLKKISPSPFFKRALEWEKKSKQDIYLKIEIIPHRLVSILFLNRNTNSLQIKIIWTHWRDYSFKSSFSFYLFLIYFNARNIFTHIYWAIRYSLNYIKRKLKVSNDLRIVTAHSHIVLYWRNQKMQSKYVYGLLFWTSCYQIMG